MVHVLVLRIHAVQVLHIMSENLFCCFCLKVISSDTSGSESKSESDWSESCCSDDEDPEEWHEEVDDLLEDMANDEPPPELI